jgi:hypothetical protein
MSDTQNEIDGNPKARKRKYPLFLVSGLLLLIIATIISYPFFIIHNMLNRTDTVSMMLPVHKGTNQYDFILPKDSYTMNFMFFSSETKETATVKGSYRVVSENHILTEDTYDITLDAEAVNCMVISHATFLKETRENTKSMSSPPYPWTHIYDDYVSLSSLRMAYYRLKERSQVTVTLDVDELEGSIYLHIETNIDSL